MITNWSEIESTILAADRSLLWGPPGTGKTTIVYKLAEKVGAEVFSVSLHDETTVPELTGHFVPVGDRFIWMDGAALSAWRTGAWLLLDELDLAASGVFSVLRGILNDFDVARMTIPNRALAGMSDEDVAAALLANEGAEHVRPAAGFKVISTMNASPDELDSPLLDRFEPIWYVGEPHPDAIASLPEYLRKLAFSTCVDSNPETHIGIRKWKAFCKLETVVGDAVAANAVFGPRSRDVLASIKTAKAAAPKPSRPEPEPAPTAEVPLEIVDVAEAHGEVPATSMPTEPVSGAEDASETPSKPVRARGKHRIVVADSDLPLKWTRERPLAWRRYTGGKGKPAKVTCPACGNDRQARMVLDTDRHLKCADHIDGEPCGAVILAPENVLAYDISDGGAKLFAV